MGSGARSTWDRAHATCDSIACHVDPSASTFARMPSSSTTSPTARLGASRLAIDELQLEGLRGGAREPMGVRRPRERAPGARHGQPLERTFLRMGGLDRAAVPVYLTTW